MNARTVPVLKNLSFAGPCDPGRPGHPTRARQTAQKISPKVGNFGRAGPGCQKIAGGTRGRPPPGAGETKLGYNKDSDMKSESRGALGQGSDTDRGDRSALWCRAVEGVMSRIARRHERIAIDPGVMGGKP